MRTFAYLLVASALVTAACTSTGGGGGGATGAGSTGGGATGACKVDADCGASGLCGFPESAGCSATGTCFSAPGARCQAYSPGCACDGSVINVACTGLPSGYFSKPLAHTGACVDSGCYGGNVCLSPTACATDADCAVLGSRCDLCSKLCGCGAGECCPATWSMYSCTYPDGGSGMACHDPAKGCASSLTCGQGCDAVVTGRCDGG